MKSRKTIARILIMILICTEIICLFSKNYTIANNEVNSNDYSLHTFDGEYIGQGNGSEGCLEDENTFCIQWNTNLSTGNYKAYNLETLNKDDYESLPCGEKIYKLLHKFHLA